MSAADANVRRFVWFRTLFNARYYYPVFGVLFLDYGLTLEQMSVLNFVWAIAIVGLEVPSGALADLWGRKRLLVLAAAFMVGEMLLLAWVPLGNATLIFAVFLVNRILSGAAEASASGADEALVYDSLRAEGREGEWSLVLQRTARWQSLAFILTMVTGGLVYDPHTANAIATWVGSTTSFDARTTMRFPVYLTLAHAVVALFVTLGFRESAALAGSGAISAAETWRLIRRAAGWILRSPVALFLIVAGLLHDSVARLVLTMGSNYYRLIDVPVAAFGLIGAAFGAFGLFVPAIARRMVERRGIGWNFTALAAVTLLALTGLTLQRRWAGVVFVFLLGAVMNALGFFLSHYLNALVASADRATILSFRGLAYNLGYGTLSLLFAGLLSGLAARPGIGPEGAFGSALSWLPFGFALALIPLVILARRTPDLGSSPAPRG